MMLAFVIMRTDKFGVTWTGVSIGPGVLLLAFLFLPVQP